jgi:hypothetical protein
LKLACELCFWKSQMNSRSLDGAVHIHHYTRSRMLRLKFMQHSLYHGKQPFLWNTVEKAD